jgi:uncharacterized cupin superfamily protein
MINPNKVVIGPFSFVGNEDNQHHLKNNLERIVRYLKGGKQNDKETWR